MFYIFFVIGCEFIKFILDSFWEDETHRQALIPCSLTFSMGSFTKEILKQSGAQITINLSKSIFTKMHYDSYSLLVLVMKK